MEPGKHNKKQIRVADWMTETVLAVETFDSISIARQLMAKHRINQLPVLDNDVLVGIVTDRDLRDAYPTSMMIDRGKAIDRFADSVTVEEVMSHDVFTVRPDTPLKKAVGLLRRHRIGSLPVVENRSLVGIITRSDILDFVLSGLSVRAPASTNRNNKKTTSAGRRTLEKPRD
jgi:acetoin utilization protein AcuB